MICSASTGLDHEVLAQKVQREPKRLVWETWCSMAYYCCTRKKGSEYEMLTFVHIFPSCSQDGPAVIAVTADVIKQLKIIMPTLTSVYYCQDNAGCYHSGATITCARMLGKLDDVTIKRLDFSDPQGGKGCCDRKAATM